MIIKPETIVYGKNKEKYKVLDFINSGAFGHVYKIKRNRDKSIWALKTLPSAFQDKDVLRGLINEGNLATKVYHKNVIKYSFFHDGSLYKELPPYIIMEFAGQGTLKNIIQQQKETGEFLANGELKKYFKQLIDGMEAVNSQLIHRDIKPDNILIKDNLLKISDFGLSKIVQEQTRTSTFKGFGHIRYMSPEGWKNEENTIQMDIYSMGIVFFELATLNHPLEVDSGDDIQGWREAHFYQNPKKPEAINQNLTPMISQLILKMMEKSTSERFREWSTIKAELKKESLPSTSSAILIDNLLKKRLDKDRENKEEELSSSKQQKEFKEFCDLVKYQFKKNILEPFKKFIEEFNERYASGKIQIKSEFSDTSYEITLVSGVTLMLDIRPLFDKELYREKEIGDYGQRTVVRRLERPLLQGRKILAWGYLKSLRGGKGFNIILVEKEGDIYGEWFVLINTNNPLFGHQRRSEPFHFEFNEIEEEIRHVNATHIYSTRVEAFNLNHIVKFIEEYI